MKNFWVRLKLFLLEDGAMGSMINAHERIDALELYAKDLKWAIDKLGYDPKKHGYPPKRPA